MTPSRTRETLEVLGAPLRRLSLAGWLVGSLGLAGLALGLSAWAFRSGVLRPGLAVVLIWLVVAVLLLLTGLAGWRELGRLAAVPLAGYLERTGPHRRGSLTGMLDQAAAETSSGLAAAADERAAAALADSGAPSLAGIAAQLRRRAAGLAVVLLAGLAALASAGPSHPRVVALWSPGLSLELLAAPVRLRADPAVVDRGGTATLYLDAAGHRSATLWRRALGEPWSETTVVLDSMGQAVIPVAGVVSDLFFRLSSGGRSSDTVGVRVRVPAFLGGLEVRAVYPRYLGLEDEPLTIGADTLLLPAGTVLETRGEASTSLAGAGWRLGNRDLGLRVDGRRFSGRFAPARSGVYQLWLTPADGAALAGDPVVMVVDLVPDLPPRVEVPVPGADTVAPADLRVPVLLDASDDHGLVRVALVSRTGRQGLETSVALPLPSPGSDRALVQSVLDLSSRGIRPGDTVFYYALASDNSPAGQSARSREFTLVVPTASEQRQARREATVDARQRLDSLLAASRRLERQTEDLAGGRQRPNEPGRDPALGFEDARRAEAVARNQDQLIRDAEELQATLEALRQAAERGESPDSALAARLAEIAEQLAKALSPELRQRLAELQEALRNLDPQATREALRQLTETQQVLRQALERSRDLFRRAALEGELGTLAREAEELAGAQREWTRQVATIDTADAGKAERALAERTDSLAEGLDRVAGQLDSVRSREALQQAADRGRQAARQMRTAASAAARGDRRTARDQGEQAQADLASVSREAAAQREQQQDAWRQEVLDALDRAMAETAALSRQQLGVSEAFARGADLAGARNTQALVEESTRKLIDQVIAVSGKNALVPPQIAVALAVAGTQMAAARMAVSTGSPNLPEAKEASGEAVDALAVAVYQMVRARDDVAGSSSGSGLAEAMERMTQLARQQGQLGQQAGSLLPMMGAAGLQQQLQALASRQRALAQQLERMRARGQLPGTGEMGQEARDLAARLEAGRLDPETVQRQERLFRRMLDAGRTLEGEEQDERKERQSTTARPGEILLPPALRQRLGDGAAPRLPSWDELQRFSPEERRLVIEYFRRVAAGTFP